MSVVGVPGQCCTGLAAGSHRLGALVNPKLEHDPSVSSFTTHCLALATGELTCDCGETDERHGKNLYLKSLENLEIIILQGGTDKSVSNNECCKKVCRELFMAEGRGIFK